MSRETIDSIIAEAINLEGEAYYLQEKADSLLTKLEGRRLNREQKEDLEQLMSLVAYELINK